DRDGESERVSADLARIQLDGVLLEATSAGVQVARRDGRRVVERVVADSVTASIDLDSDWVRRTLKEHEPEVSVHDEAVTRTVNARREPAAAKEPHLIVDSARFIDLERGPRLRRALSRTATLLSSTLPESGELDLSGVRVRLKHGIESLNVGPARLHLVR